MNYIYQNNNIILYDRFDLTSTLTCGQCFRWEMTEEKKWQGVAFGHSLLVFETPDAIVFEDVSEEEFLSIWAPYFDLYTDYDKITDALCNSPRTGSFMKTCRMAANGLHILRQEPWEALCSFIISQNNNIPRIQKIIDALCRQFGDPLGNNLYTFPSYEIIAMLTPDMLASIRCGFRAKYILDAAKKLQNGELSLAGFETADLCQARISLQKISGVGPKVAECTLLYGFHRMEAFPVDVWMKRAMKRFFPENSPEDFGPYAGLVQQYIFAYSRQNPQLFSKEP